MDTAIPTLLLVMEYWPGALPVPQGVGLLGVRLELIFLLEGDSFLQEGSTEVECRDCPLRQG